MKKILLAFDGSHFSDGALEFARQLNERDPLLLTGVFLPQIDYAALSSNSGSVKTGSLYEGAQVVEDNIERFEDYCRKYKIEYTVHKDFFDLALPELKNETRFADLLILGSERFYQQAGTGKPNDYLKEALYGVECPVIVIPETFDFPANNILTYDGREESVYAIKQFAYLLPELASNDTLLVYANEKGKGQLPHEKNIEELTARHYSRLTLCKLEIDSKKQFVDWLSDKKGAIVVSGAFGGSSFSKLFHKSFVADIIGHHKLPLFIAHK